MRKNSVYSVPPGYAMEEAYLAHLKERTNRTLEEWIRIVKKSGPAAEKERMAWLKSEHGFTTNYAMWVAKRAGGGGGVENYDPDGMVEAMFSGKKAGLRPIYDHLLGLALGLGKDVKVCPAKTIVPFYRHHVFAQVKPSTNTRIDFGFALKDRKPTGKLISTGGLEKGDRITHRIPISILSEIDKEVKNWLTVSYEMDAQD
ncbi:MAG TPA: DUF5655 domain-containing protein [Bryobacteraceae bacterium]|nr:DUF5655 domain-containing protein [Bryobacteraceae bacterium]